ncbi:MAG: CBS domain-containing protein [Myxococcota bacterium]
MKASRVMTREVHCVTPEVPVARAWGMMNELRVRHLPVVFEGKLVGILSDRDLLVRAARASDGRLTFPEVPVGEAMTVNPVAVPSTTPVSKLAALMLEHRIDSIPIVDLEGQLWGLVTSTDLLELLVEPEALNDRLPFTYEVRGAGGATTAA